MDDEVRDALLKYDWPGNVRELENTIERAVVLATGPFITRSAISLLGATPPRRRDCHRCGCTPISNGWSAKRFVAHSNSPAV
jgi:DNA-binding NtrC family response regulator